MDRVLFGNYIGTESLMDIFSNGQSLYWAKVVWIASQVDRGIVGQRFIWKLRLDRVSEGQILQWTVSIMEFMVGRVGLNRVPGGRGYIWTELYLEVMFGQSLWWTESIMGKIGLDGFLVGQGCSWTEWHWEITFGQSF